jgi:hypothetical protein
MKPARVDDGPPDFEDMRREAREACEGAELQEVLDAIQDLEKRWAEGLALEAARVCATSGPVAIRFVLFAAVALLFALLLAYEAFDTFARRPALEVAALALGVAVLLFLAGGSAILSMRMRRQAPFAPPPLTGRDLLRLGATRQRGIDGRTAVIGLAFVAFVAFAQVGEINGKSIFLFCLVGSGFVIGWLYGKYKFRGRAPWEIFLSRAWSVITKVVAVAGAALIVVAAVATAVSETMGGIAIRIALALLLFGAAAFLLWMFFSRPREEP